MRLRRAPRPLHLATAVLGVALAWLVVGWAGGAVDGGTSVRPGATQPSIERVDVLAAIVSDRPAPSTRSDRAGSLRVLPALAGATAGSSSLPPVLTGDVGFPTSPVATGPLSFGVARRGPPAAASR